MALVLLSSIMTLVLIFRIFWYYHCTKRPRSWYRCARCGMYACQKKCRCLGKLRPSLHIPLSTKQTERLIYHQRSYWHWILSDQDGNRFLSFALQIEDLTDEVWDNSDVGPIFLYLRDDKTRLTAFLKFYRDLKAQIRGPLCLSGVIKLFIARGNHETSPKSLPPDPSDTFYW